jgi:adenylate kinase
VRVLMIAPPGAGKRTQGKLIAEHFAIPHIATGDLLRDHVARGTQLGLAVRDSIDRGEFVPDGVVLELVRDALVRTKAQGGRGGYVLDGVPRTMEQARSAFLMCREMDLLADVALYLKADDAELTRRLLRRARVQGGGDDTEEVIGRRLALYHEVTHPLVEWYGERGILITVDAIRPADVVGREILGALTVMRSVVEHVPASARTPIDPSALTSRLTHEAGLKTPNVRVALS